VLVNATSCNIGDAMIPSPQAASTTQHRASERYMSTEESADPADHVDPADHSDAQLAAAVLAQYAALSNVPIGILAIIAASSVRAATIASSRRRPASMRH
jgi:hypothetical protein